MKIEEIREIVELMSEHDLSEFKIESGDVNLCIKRGLGHNMPASIVSPPIISSHATAPSHVSVSPSAVALPADSGPLKQSDDKAGKITIDSPIVGTFYRSPSPEAPSYVKVGDKVTLETVVCIIEAMKVMNEIKAEKSGVIKEILVENANPVEYGQPLFVIE